MFTCYIMLNLILQTTIRSTWLISFWAAWEKNRKENAFCKRINWLWLCNSFNSTDKEFKAPSNRADAVSCVSFFLRFHSSFIIASMKCLSHFLFLTLYSRGHVVELVVLDVQHEAVCGQVHFVLGIGNLKSQMKSISRLIRCIKQPFHAIRTVRAILWAARIFLSFR